MLRSVQSRASERSFRAELQSKAQKLQSKTSKLQRRERGRLTSRMVIYSLSFPLRDANFDVNAEKAK